MLADVTTLSDDETAVVPVQPPEPVKTLPSRKRKLGPEELSLVFQDLRRNLRTTVNSNCRCWGKLKSRSKRNCFSPFRDPATFDKIFQLRKSLRTMWKVDADQTLTFTEGQRF